MSGRGRTTKTWGLLLTGFIDAINQGAINRRIGVYVGWLILAMALISAANTVSPKALSASPNAFPESQWFLFAALFLLAAGYTSQRNKHGRVDTQQGVKRHSCPKDIMTVALKVTPELHEYGCATNPMLRRVYQSWKVFRNTQFPRHRITETSFSNFMANQQLPFR
jgi:TRAP-type mannitol/chloroaromatic compound transport system permease small subunit